MDTKFTPGPWHIIHWEKGECGVTFLKAGNGILYYSGDAVNEKLYGIRANIDPRKHSIQSSFEGGHIANIRDFVCLDGGEEVMANAKLIAAAPDLLKACMDVVDKYDDILGSAGEPILSVKNAIKKAIG